MHRKERIIPQSIQDFIDNQRINGIKDNTIRDQTSKLLVANEFKPIINWKKDDITKYILSMKDRELSDTFIENVKSLIKKFFKFHGKEAYVKDLKIKVPFKKLKSVDIITPDDINKLIEAADNNRDKAFIALLFETGGRISEVLELRVKDIQETDKGMRIDVLGTKTGEETRPCLCVYSGQYIRNHILYPSLKPEDKLFDFHRSTSMRVLKALKQKTGITKPLTHHALRHAQATYMVRKGYNETVIRSKLGWTDDSKMIARYVSIDGEDVINATSEKEGNTHIPKEAIKPINIAQPIQIADPTLLINDMRNENEEENKRLIEEMELMKHEHAQEFEDFKADYMEKMSSMEKMINNFMKNSKKE